jgi:26S proteasome regulatory subunit T6
LVEEKPSTGLESYYKKKVEELELKILDKKNNLRRLEAQRNEMNNLVKNLKEELYLLLQPAS